MRRVLQAERTAAGPWHPDWGTLGFRPAEAFGVPLRRQLCKSLRLLQLSSLSTGPIPSGLMRRSHSSARVQRSFSARPALPLFAHLPQSLAVWIPLHFGFSPFTPDSPLLFSLLNMAPTLNLCFNTLSKFG